MAKRDVVKIHGSGVMNMRRVEREQLNGQFLVLVYDQKEALTHQLVCESADESRQVAFEVAHQTLTDVLHRMGIRSQ